jgi:predicted amidohydrolase
MNNAATTETSNNKNEGMNMNIEKTISHVAATAAARAEVMELNANNIMSESTRDWMDYLTAEMNKGMDALMAMGMELWEVIEATHT